MITRKKEFGAHLSIFCDASDIITGWALVAVVVALVWLFF